LAAYSCFLNKYPAFSILDQAGFVYFLSFL